MHIIMRELRLQVNHGLRGDSAADLRRCLIMAFAAGSTIKGGGEGPPSAARAPAAARRAHKRCGSIRVVAYQ